MIDKVEVRIPAAAPFTRDFGEIYSQYSRDPKVFHEARHYLRSGDLRQLGFQSILHVGCRHGKAGNHKLELIDTGVMSYSEIQREISQVFDVDPWRLGVMRIDLAADVEGVPVRWFLRNARVKFKQWVNAVGKIEATPTGDSARGIQKIEYAEMGRRELETLYFGKRPNCIRIYNKISELHHQYNRALRGSSDAVELPSFEDTFGYPREGFVLTRVERQIAGGRVPEPLDSLGKLHRLLEFNPFELLELLPGSKSEPDVNDYELLEYCKGRGLRTMAEEMGMHRLRSFINKRSEGNASRTLEKYAAFLPQGSGIDAGELFQRYRDSISKQLAA